MDLSNLKELAPVSIAIGALAYVCFKLIKELSDSRKNYSTFVEENNHISTDLIKEATATMVEVKNSISQHNEILKNLIDKIK